LFSADDDPEVLKAIYMSQNRLQYILLHVLLQGETKSKYHSQKSTILLKNEEDNTSNDTSYSELQLTFNCELKGH